MHPDLNSIDVGFPVTWLLISAVSAFGLNISVFLLIGRSSALTMNVAGVIKDWLLILLSVVLYQTPVGSLQIFGYGIAFAGVCWYNYQKLQGMQSSPKHPEPSDPENKPLLSETADENKS
ncbi:hypothetical protein Vafri_6676 [Volvox africanus]|nr:hypothetical protein Vafri_6676 [Volvox africanus]